MYMMTDSLTCRPKEKPCSGGPRSQGKLIRSIKLVSVCFLEGRPVSQSAKLPGLFLVPYQGASRAPHHPGMRGHIYARNSGH